MAKLPLINGWEIGFTQDVVVASLERGGMDDTAIDVDFAEDATEASVVVRDALERYSFEEEWDGSDEDLAFLKTFAYRY